MQLCYNSKAAMLADPIQYDRTLYTTGPFPVCDSWEFSCAKSVIYSNWHFLNATEPQFSYYFFSPSALLDIPRPFLTHKSTYRLWSRKTTSCQNKQTHKQGKFLIKISKSLINELLNFRGSDRLTILLRSATLTPSALMLQFEKAYKWITHTPGSVQGG